MSGAKTIKKRMSLDDSIKKYGEESGTKRYHGLQNYTLYYRDSNDNSKKEWFISDISGVSFYDFCVREANTILEYDGAKWHPTKDQASMIGDELMEMTNMSFREKYLIDENKKQKALQHGFFVFTVRSDFTEDQKQSVIDKFLEKTRENVSKGQK